MVWIRRTIVIVIGVIGLVLSPFLLEAWWVNHDGRVLVSADGHNWTAMWVGPHLDAVVYGDQFVAVGRKGAIFISATGKRLVRVMVRM